MSMGWDYQLARDVEAHYDKDERNDCPECGSYMRHPNRYEWICSNDECGYEYNRGEDVDDATIC